MEEKKDLTDASYEEAGEEKYEEKEECPSCGEPLNAVGECVNLDCADSDDDEDEDEDDEEDAD